MKSLRWPALCGGFFAFCQVKSTVLLEMTRRGQMKKLSIWLSDLAVTLDIAIANHARVPSSPCKWYCKPGAKVADWLRNLSNKIYKD